MSGSPFSGLGLTFAPYLPLWLLVGLALLALVVAGLGLARRAPGSALRLFGAVLLLGALLNPILVRETRDYHKDVAVLLVDDSPSQAIGDRPAVTAAAVDKIVADAQRLPDLDLRVVRAGRSGGVAQDDGTQLIGALEGALADVPRRRFAGAILVTDGQVHDVPPAGLSSDLGPIHTLLTGRPGERDRRLVIVRAPTFGLVEKPVAVTFRVDDPGATAQVAVTLRQDAETERTMLVPPNQDVTVEFTLTHGGQTILDLRAAEGPQELTPINNRAVIAVNGVRDRLRVLLISGEPHPGERTWRNLLKSDPSVDLVHFTILRPADRLDGTPINELSLIAFPIRELFEVRLKDFDLIIFDRYRRRNIIPNAYLKAIGDYVQAGGAVLEVAGPAYATNLGLYYSPLGDVLPAEPTGRVFEQPFRAALTPLGERHPVTRGLEGAGGGPAEAPPSWGKWFRQIEVMPRRGQAVMQGANAAPLLVLDRVGEGRIAQIASDHIWLWTRGYDGGGPQAELLRRIAHWLMKEPALEEEDLIAQARGDRLEIQRRSLGQSATDLRVLLPDGTSRTVALRETAPGLATGSTPLDGPGVYTVADGQRARLVAVGAINPREYSDVRASAAALAPISDVSGGGLHWLGESGVPALRKLDAERSQRGRDWIGLAARRDFDVTGIETLPLLPVWLVLLLGTGAAMLAWWREGRR